MKVTIFYLKKKKLVADKVCLVAAALSRPCRTALSRPCRALVVGLVREGDVCGENPCRALSEALSVTRFLLDACFEGCLRRNPLSRLVA